MRHISALSQRPPSRRRYHRRDVLVDVERPRCGDDRSSLLVSDDGYVMALVGLMIIPLMVFVAFAVDLGAWYAQGSRLQRAADSAAMAGVVWLPLSGTADAQAVAAAQRNGFSTGAGVTVSAAMVSQTRYRVSITAPAPRYFSQAFGMAPFNLTRFAIAEFNKPIPMGSPTNKFGNDLNPANCPQMQPQATAPCGPQPMLWSSIQSPYERFDNGDPYTTKCPRVTPVGSYSSPANYGSPSGCDAPANPNGAANPLYRGTGYDFAVEVKPSDVGTPHTLSVYDAQQSARLITGNQGTGAGTANGYPRSSCPAGTPPCGNWPAAPAPLDNSDCRRLLAPFTSAPFTSANWNGFGGGNCQTGDAVRTSGCSGVGCGAANHEFQLFDNDLSDLTVLFTAPLPACRLFVPYNAAVATYKNTWVPICTFTPTAPGIYPLRVRSSNIAGQLDRGSGYNAFSLRVTGGPSARVYSLGDMSIWTPTPASSAKFYLAEIGPEHAGKKVQVDLYDPGDGSGSTDFWMQVKAPPGGSPAVVPTGGVTIPAPGLATSCSYNPAASATKGPATPSSAPSCRIRTRIGGASGGIYNNSWLRVEIQLDTAYTCTTDCWWIIEYDFGVGSSFPTDRTVWSLNVVGDPVHLVQ